MSDNEASSLNHDPEHQVSQGQQDMDPTTKAYVESLMSSGLSREQAEQALILHGINLGTVAAAAAMSNSAKAAAMVAAEPTLVRSGMKRRKPVKWEAWEEANLIEGVKRFGRGNWAQIRTHFQFNPCRTNVDLHDKWRVLTGSRKRNKYGNTVLPSIPNSVDHSVTGAEQSNMDNDPTRLLAAQAASHFFAPYMTAAALPQEFLQSLGHTDLMALITGQAMPSVNVPEVPVVEEETIQAEGGHRKKQKSSNQENTHPEMNGDGSLVVDEPVSKKGRGKKAKKAVE